MRKILRISPAVIVALVVGFISGCEWENSSDDQFNTSQGAGTEINFSGIYVAREEGGELVAGTDITRLQITQTGNRLDVVDSNGRKYEGVTGSPGVIADPLEFATDGTPRYPEGTLMSLLQINFWNDGESASVHDDIYFSGYIRFVATTEITSQNRFTDMNVDAGPVTINESTSYSYSVNETKSMMVLEGQWTESDEFVTTVNGWSENYTVFWSLGPVHEFPSQPGTPTGPSSSQQ